MSAKKTQDFQNYVPPPDPREAELLAAGWIKVSAAEAPAPGKVWLWPSQGKTERVFVGNKSEDGGRVVTPQFQMSFPSSPWHYDLEDAWRQELDRRHPLAVRTGTDSLFRGKKTDDHENEGR
jgi:hypothetical protein